MVDYWVYYEDRLDKCLVRSASCQYFDILKWLYVKNSPFIMLSVFADLDGSCVLLQEKGR